MIVSVEIERKTQVIADVAPDEIPFDDLLAAQEPAILKGVARSWPIVRAGLESSQQAMSYIKSFYNGQQITGFTGRPEIGGRFFYDDDVTGLNFEARRVLLNEFFERLETHLSDERPPAFYIGSTDVDAYLPGLRAENDLTLNNPMFEIGPLLVSIWIGNRTVAAAHFDMTHNLACCVAGRRRFTLFPPEQTPNLYPGPLEPTPGGQAVSMVDFNAPDFDRHPRFKKALAAGQVAEMEPGDVLFYPAMWWHQVEALDAFNIMINYWWSLSPPFMDTPMNTILHGLLSLRDRPEAEKQAWRELFDYYVFGPSEQAGEHLPKHARGALGPLDEPAARRLRAQLLGRLNR